MTNQNTRGKELSWPEGDLVLTCCANPLYSTAEVARKFGLEAERIEPLIASNEGEALIEWAKSTEWARREEMAQHDQLALRIELSTQVKVNAHIQLSRLQRYRSFLDDYTFPGPGGGLPQALTLHPEIVRLHRKKWQ